MRSAEPLRLGRTHGGARLRLGLRNLYILPTRFGLLWLAGAALLQVVGIQTQRNGPLLLSFLLLALMLLTLHLSHFNLQGLELQVGDPQPGFADETLIYPLQLHSSCRREAVQLRLERGAELTPQRLPSGQVQIGLPWRCGQRGLQQPGAVLIHSRAPLGLFICWSRWQPPKPQAVIPARRRGPIERLPLGPTDGSSSELEAGRNDGSEHWQDLRPHRPEDNPSRLAWKAMAQGRGRLSKVFREGEQTPLLLAPATGVPHERALEHLSAAVWELAASGERYGLQLADGAIAVGQGREHRDRCLLALALTP